MTEQDIIQWFHAHPTWGLTPNGRHVRYVFVGDGIIDVYGDLWTHGKFRSGMLEFPPDISIRNIFGGLRISGAGLTTLKGCPEFISTDFWIRSNKISSLTGGPKYVGNDYNATNCYLTDTEGFPKEVGEKFEISLSSTLYGFYVTHFVTGKMVAKQNGLLEAGEIVIREYDREHLHLR